MKIRKSLRLALGMVVHSKLRSWLTILGIVIGVASVIAIMSLGAGLKANVDDRLGGLGADLLTLTAGASRGMDFGGHDKDFGGGSASATDEEPEIDKTDVQVLKGIPDILAIDTQISEHVTVYFLGKQGTISLTGVDPKTWSAITTEEIRDGRMLGPADQNVVVIGAKLADEYFDQPIGINKMLTIEDRSVRVVGVLDDQSTNIYMPIQMTYSILTDKDHDVYDSVIVKVKDVNQIDLVMNKIEKKLFQKRHVDNRTKDFSIHSQQQAAQRFSDVASSITLFLTAIAAVSLLVGAVGIANTMFTSVLEKTKDIGIMKAIGAKNRDILMIFLINASLIGLIGGALGVVFGVLLSKIMPFLVPNMRILGGQAVVSTNSIFLALVVSIGVGLLAGIIPAYQASKLKPVDALRYE